MFSQGGNKNALESNGSPSSLRQLTLSNYIFL